MENSWVTDDNITELLSGYEGIVLGVMQYIDGRPVDNKTYLCVSSITKKCHIWLTPESKKVSITYNPTDDASMDVEVENIESKESMCILILNTILNPKLSSYGESF